ncbi:MAG: hypothetical protein OEV08_08185 [Nitrospira sp.]|nr:hypothetical protein [Nitrospira sp.]
MRVVSAKCSPIPRISRSRWVLSPVLFIIVAVGAVHADDDLPTVWQGIYHSTSKDRDVTVRLSVPSDGSQAELFFVTESCRLGLSERSASIYGIGRTAPDIDPGPYCAIWLGGQLETKPVGGGRISIKVELVSANGRSRVEATLHQTSGTH